MRQNQFDLQVLVNGKPIREYEGPEGQTYVEGRNGSNFTLRLRNFSGARVLAVLTVDGLDVITGKVGDYKDNGGYVIPAYGYIDIPGWRLDNSEVAKFVFNAIGESYSTESGHGKKNVGVIGAALFYEKQPYYYNNIYYTVTSNVPSNYTGDGGETWTQCSSTLGDATMSFDGNSTTVYSCSTLSSPKPPSAPLLRERKLEGEQQLGTGFGKAAAHRVTDVAFTKATDAPAEVLSLYYDSYERLKRAGVIRQHKAEVCTAPSPFPKNVGPGCKPPKGWSR